MMVPKDDKNDAAGGRITPDRFYSNNKEKTKLNRFLFDSRWRFSELFSRRSA